jgi:hypothetical protein
VTGIPRELCRLPRWLVWRNEERHEGGGTGKVPYSPTRLRAGRPARADVTDPAAWGTLEQAQPLSREFDGLGIALGDIGDGLVLSGVDLDTCISEGSIEPWSQQVVDRLASYTEVSPSQTGLKVFFLTTRDDHDHLRSRTGSKWSQHTGTNHPPAIELMLADHYFTVTGQQLGEVSILRVVPADDIMWVNNVAGPLLRVGSRAAMPEAAGGGDQSRSAVAFRRGLELVRTGANYEEMCEALATEPATADWVRQKGSEARGRQLRRIWEKAQQSQRMGDRPVVRVIGGQLPVVVDDAEDALLAGSDLYQRGDFIVRVAMEPILVSDERRVSGLRLIRVGVPNMREHLCRVADFKRFDARGSGAGKWVSIDPPGEIAAAYLARIGEWRLRVLTGIVGAPTLRRDGSVLDTPGYDAPTGILYDPGGIEFPPVPAEPTRADAEAALAMVGELLDEYPFISEAARSVAVSAILTGLVRRAVDHAPMHAFTAPTAGSGKSNLVDVAAVFATGHEAPVIAASRSEEELEKRLGSLLLAGDVMVSFDNCDHPLRGSLLNQVLTQAMVKVRILGKSETHTVISNALVCATGNNLVVEGDLTRRTILCGLDPAVERPELRRFRHADPVLRVKARRADYVVAGLTVLRAHVVAGSPDLGLVPLNGFGDWSRLVRSTLVWLGMDDPVTTQELLRDDDPELENISAVFRAWEAAEGLHKPTTATKLIALANQREGDWDLWAHPLLHDALHAVAGRGQAIDARALGLWLNRIKDRIVVGLCARRDGVTDGTSRWRLETARAAGRQSEVPG